MPTRSNAHPLRLPAGSVLFSPGQECPGFVRLHSGSIRVSLTAENGREVVLYRVAPGGLCLQTFSCLIDGRRYSAEGRAETDIEGEIVPHAAFQRNLAEDAAFRAGVFRAVAERFSDYEQLVEEVALTGFDARLARVLTRLATNGVLQMTHESLAAETASGRAFVSRRLAEFERNGIIARRRGEIEILDFVGLERIAQETG
ncbi:Crp/Fnr family transcriptional regulator [Tropicimonas sp. TH_r6]|uniref:Crp/Fnr family transcriptional regulator n=1 Tax=Tropicimonas sp. TH_r6 TaxID=3082085 RepID=UPI0029545470|nr:Crp/Fnr family transcriptional regulator [Tropicimonas sp. TH_r6]MDV7145837.1 Crp/Fnr family transcriptional regulator [Tropicimonas sp. TH_r6]